MPRKIPYVYILASKPYSTLYVGVTSDLAKRIWQHREGLVEGFTRKYKIHQLVWFERHHQMIDVIAREKNIKNWRRAWKISLIVQTNPDWYDLYPGL